MLLPITMSKHISFYQISVVHHMSDGLTGYALDLNPRNLEMFSSGFDRSGLADLNCKLCIQLSIHMFAFYHILVSAKSG